MSILDSYHEDPFYNSRLYANASTMAAGHIMTAVTAVFWITAPRGRLGC